MKIRKLHVVIGLLFCGAGAAQAQESNLDLSVGLKAWDTQWTTWSYGLQADGVTPAITQEPVKDKVVLIPLLTVRYKDLVGSFSGFAPTTFEFPDGKPIRRKEYDLNVGWRFTPGVAVAVGYKRSAQIAEFNYEVGGPTISVNATAPIRGPFSMYGTVGLGRLKSTSGSNVKFDTVDYQLAEVGAAYSIAVGNIPKAVSVTLGYRTQVLNTKEALDSQNARDLTQGFTLAVFAVF